MRTDFYFDPWCPWCWITSRWLVEVAGQRDLHVRWRPFSLYLKDFEMAESGPGSEAYRVEAMFTHRLLRVIEAVRADLGDHPVGALYTEMGERIHLDRDKGFGPEEILSKLGIDTKYAAAAEDQAWDEVIVDSMKDLFAVCGTDIGVPSLVFEGKDGFFGPVISPAPTGDAAGDLFDSMYTMATTPGFWELKRDRVNPLIIADRT